MQLWLGRQPDHLDMALGPDGPYWGGVPWPARIALCEAFWIDHRDEILAEHPPGSRPWAWWAFDAREDMPRPDAEPVRLIELGELTPEEIDAVEQREQRRRQQHHTTTSEGSANAR